MFRSHTDILHATVPIEGRRVLEVGCGDGRLLGWLERRGAWAVGIDPDPAQLTRAHAVGGALLVRATGEQLPFAPATFDLVLFFNSLHHVPAAAQARALAEAARVLGSGGDLVVVEPLAQGPWFELLRPLEDETDIRAHAYGVLLAEAPAAGLTPVREREYTSRVEVASLAAATERLLAANPQRRTTLKAALPEIEQRFATTGQPTDTGFLFAQPMRLNHLRKTG